MLVVLLFCVCIGWMWDVFVMGLLFIAYGVVVITRVVCWLVVLFWFGGLHDWFVLCWLLGGCYLVWMLVCVWGGLG